MQVAGGTARTTSNVLQEQSHQQCRKLPLICRVTWWQRASREGNVPGCVKGERASASGLSGAGKETPCHFHRWMSPIIFKVPPSWRAMEEQVWKWGLERVSRPCLCPERISSAETITERRSGKPPVVVTSRPCQPAPLLHCPPLA